MRRLDALDISEISRMMIFLVTTREGFEFYTPCGRFKSFDAAIIAVTEWLQEDI